MLLPVRRVRWTTAGLAAFQVSHDEFDCPSCEPPAVDTATLAATQFGWSFSSAKAFGYSISAEQGASAAVTTELRRSGEGGSGTAGAATVDVRGYARVLPRHGVLAVRAAGATTWGDQAIRRVFDAGGSGAQTLGFDFGSHAINLLRGFDSSDLYGFHAAVFNLDYRFPLGWPQRGYGTLPAMVRNLHGAVFVDAGNAWDTSLSRRRLPPIRWCRAVVGHCPCRSLPADDHRWRGVAARSVREGWRMGGVCAGRARVLIRGELPVLAGRWLRIVAA